MTYSKTAHLFHAALPKASVSRPQAPTNTYATRREAEQALQRVSNLIGYRTYLAKARSFKAARTGAAPDFERDVRTHAAQALEDGKDVAAALLRQTKQDKHTGVLDRALDAWISSVSMSGPVETHDLWSEIANDASTRQILRDNGMTDEMFAAVDEGIRQFAGTVSVSQGKLTAELRLASQTASRRVVFAHSASGAPRDLSDLLRRGQFDRAVAGFERGQPLAFGPLMKAQGEIEVDDVALASMAAGVAFLSQHKRKLEDTGLSTYSGNGVALGIIFLAGIALLFAGGILKHWCDDDGDGGTACTIGKILTLVGLLAMCVTSIIAGDAAFGGIAGMLFLYELLKDLGANVEIESTDPNAF
jgi:hypothetical protein